MADNERQARQAQQPPGPDPKPKRLSGPLTGPDATAGPLAVSAAHPRYFMVAAGGM